MNARWLLFPLPVCLTLLLLFLGNNNPPPALAASGDLDDAFGGFSAGSVPGQSQARVNGAGDEQAIAAVARSGDGKYIVAGYRNGATDLGEWVIARYLGDGTLDTSFSQSDPPGYRVIQFADSAEATGMALQSDGKIVVVGRVRTATGDDSVVVRLTAAGNPDPGFGSNGRVITPFSATKDDAAYAVGIDGSGKIVIGGYVEGATYDEFLVARYLANGTLDNGFDTDGWNTLPFTGVDAYANAVRLTGTRIVLAGSAGEDFALGGFTPAGAIDNTFGTAGKTTTDFNGGEDVAHAITVLNGKLIVGGEAAISATDTDFALARYSVAGILDTSFGANGKTTTDFGSSQDRLYGLGVQSNGKIVAAGLSRSDASMVADFDFSVARYSGDGVLDTSFATAGKRRTDFGNHRADGALALLVDPDDRLLAAGAGTTNYTFSFGLLRYTANGGFDATFGQDGKVVGDFGPTEDDMLDLVRQSDGKFVGVGLTVKHSVSSFALARYLANGLIDTSYGIAGRVVTSFSADDAAAVAAAILPNNRVLAVGNSSGGITMARYRIDGTLDPAFGSGGAYSTTLGIRAKASDVALLADGKFLVAGNADDTGTSEFMLARFQPNGIPDTTFGGTGYITRTIGTGARAEALAVGSDNKIVVAGWALVNGEVEFAAARFLPDGSPDNSFGGDGVVTTNIAAADFAFDLALQPDGKIVLAGEAGNLSAQASKAAAPQGGGAFSDIVLVRYAANGELDSSFGTAGISRTHIDGEFSHSANVVRLADGRFAVAGYNNDNLLLALYSANGVRSNDFGGADGITTAFPKGHGFASALLALPGGKLLMGATAYSVAGYGRFALARFEAPGTTQPCTTSFSDVRDTDYFHDPVIFLACHSVISGYGDGSFKPFNNATRGQLAKIVVGAEGWALASPATATFRDVPTGSPFFQFVETAVGHGIISGYTDAIHCGSATPCFQPNANVTRGQLSKIVVGAEGWNLVTPATATFRDVPTSHTFYNFVETAVVHGIISGYGDAAHCGSAAPCFQPGANATRGQIAKIVYGAITDPAIVK